MDNWRKFFTIMIVVDLIVIGVWSYLTLRTREYQSADGQLIYFPLEKGWIVEIRTDSEQTVSLVAASSEYFYLQRVDSPRDVIVGEPSERPVNYQGREYFLAEEKVRSSDWIIKEASSAECQLEHSQGAELYVRTYPQLYVVFQVILATTLVVLAFSLLIALFVWGNN